MSSLFPQARVLIFLRVLEVCQRIEGRTSEELISGNSSYKGEEQFWPVD